MSWPDWGTVPQWVSTGSFFVAAVAYRHQVHARADDEHAKREAARREREKTPRGLVPTVELVKEDRPEQFGAAYLYKVTVMNLGTEPVTDLDVEVDFDGAARADFPRPKTPPAFPGAYRSASARLPRPPKRGKPFRQHVPMLLPGPDNAYRFGVKHEVSTGERPVTIVVTAAFNVGGSRWFKDGIGGVHEMDDSGALVASDDE